MVNASRAAIPWFAVSLALSCCSCGEAAPTFPDRTQEAITAWVGSLELAGRSVPLRLSMQESQGPLSSVFQISGTFTADTASGVVAGRISGARSNTSVSLLLSSTEARSCGAQGRVDSGYLIAATLSADQIDGTAEEITCGAPVLGTVSVTRR